jgi:hypothetical protein
MDEFNVPPQISVGFQNRSDTYTGKLGFVVRTSKTGKISSEKSWNGWRDDKIDPLVVDNEPTEGFVLNKGVGGARNSYSWNVRNEYIRVYDPRGFEFEITVPNLLFILQECSAIKGKGLEGEFVFAWSGSAKVMLLPVSSQEYKASYDLGSLKAKRVDKSEMVPGCTYLTKKNEQVIYLGRFEWGEIKYKYNSGGREFSRKKRHIFVYVDQIDKDKNSYDKYWVQDGFTKLSEKVTNEPISTFADIFDGFSKSQFAAAPSKFTTTSKTMTINNWGSSTNCWLPQNDGSFLKCYARRSYNGSYYRRSDQNAEEVYDIFKNTHVSLFNGKFKIEYTSGNPVKTNLTKEQVESMSFVELYIKFDNGSKLKLNY